MNSLRYTIFSGALVLLCVLTIGLPAQVFAYTQWSINDDATNCRTCHGDFRAGVYISAVDGQNWGNIHNLHRSTMLSGDCDACHIASDRFPVPIDDSAGGDGLESIGCMGCHGRAEDNVAGNPSFPHGYGAGLRQHHTNAGVNDCLPCHDDADPLNYTPVGEEVLPPYYANPGNNHPAIPTAACNDDGSENFAGATIGLDNDGNDVYDGDDADCNLSGVPQGSSVARLLQNHPNPFNPSTQIKYVVEQPGQVRLHIYAVNGKRVRTLVDAHHDVAMTYEATWNGRDDTGRPLPSGVFFYRLESAVASEMKTMVLLK
jgi:hypothetical protein